MTVDEVTCGLLREISAITGREEAKLSAGLSLAENGIDSMGFVELLLSVKADGTYAINSDAVTLEELSARLDADPDKLLNIYMDEKAPFAAFVKVLDLAKVKRAGRFVISTRDPGESRSSGSDGAAAPESEQHGEQ